MKDIKTTVYIKPKQTPGFTSILSELCQSFSPGTRAPWCGIPQSLHSLRVQAYYIMVPCVNNADTLMWTYEGAQQSQLIAAFGVQWYNHSPWVLSQPRSVSSTIWTPGEKQPDTLTHNGGLDTSHHSLRIRELQLRPQLYSFTYKYQTAQNIYRPCCKM